MPSSHSELTDMVIAQSAFDLGRLTGGLWALLLGLGVVVGILWWISVRAKRRQREGLPLPSAGTLQMPTPHQLTPQEAEDRLARILKRVRRIELITRGMVKETLGGQYHSRFKGQGIEFDDFREYQAGDDVRFLDWNVTARMNEPFVRKYIEERELTVLLVVDVSGSGDYGSLEDSKRERAAEVAAFANARRREQ